MSFKEVAADKAGTRGMERMEIVLQRSATEGLGFNIRGGTDMPHMAGDTGIFVTKLRDDGAAAADGRLAEGDKIIEINGQSLENLDHRTAVTMFKKAGNVVRLKVAKNAEQAILAMSSKKVNPKSTPGTTGVFIFGLGAILVLGLSLYKCRGTLKSLLQRLTHSHSDATSRYVHRPYSF